MHSPEEGSHRSNLLTVVPVALVAYAACDMIHEVVGHGLACALTPRVHAVSISTVALQTSAPSRWVAAAGSIANVVVGALLLFLFRRRQGFGPMGYFLWLLATLNLLNGTGYLFFSGLLNVGDWSVVISGLQPSAVWRTLLAIVGAAAYTRAVALSASSLSRMVLIGSVDRKDTRRLLFPAYVSGGLLLVAGAARNPIGANLIWLSGVSSGFGAMAGLLFVPRIVERLTANVATRAAGLRPSLSWAVVGALVTWTFVGLLGPGIPLTPQ